MIQLSGRERIFAAAIELFCERGFRETTVGDIEEAAGLTRRAGGFYRHFRSKDDVLVQAVERMAGEMIADLQLDHVVALKSPRAELLVIAQALLRHAETYRPFRLFVQREGHKLPALKRAARRANARLATADIVPWVKNVLVRCGREKVDARELGLVIFGPVLLHLISIDRGDPAFGLKDEKFLGLWADHWARWLAGSGKKG